jgi:hypothetical protein
MFSFQSRTALWNAMRRRFHTNNQAFIYFFDGPVPETFDDIPFDTNDMVQVYAESKYAQLIEADDNLEVNFGASSGYASTTAFTQFHTFARIGKPRVFHRDQRWGKWRLEPKYMFPTFYIDPDTRKGADTQYQDTETELRSGHLYYRYSQRAFMFEPDQEEHVDSNFGGTTVWGNRSPFQNPWQFEYEQPVTIDAFEYKQWSDPARNANRIDLIEYWDDSLNEGAGGWVEHVVDLEIYDEVQPQHHILRIPPMTTTKFRLYWGDTGSSSFVINHIFPLGQEPTWGKDPINFTWALLGGEHDSFSSYFSRNQTDSATENGGYPFILLDVSESDGDGACKLDRANGLRGDYAPLIQDLSIEFKD